MGHGHHHHGHHHGHHHHGHGHASGAARNRKALVVVLCLAATYMVVQVVGAFYTNSLALLADAGHLLSDVGAIALSLFAIWIAQKPATPRHTYGYYRTEILAALVNGAALIAISIIIFIEAYRRLMDPQPVVGGVVMMVALGGLVVNVSSLLILNRGRKESLNVRGAWLHIFTDLLGTFGVLTSGFLIWRFGWYWADPAASFAIGSLVIYASWHLLREAVGVLLEGTPAHIDPSVVREAIAGVDGVVDVHDLHIWTITSGMEALSGHVVVPDGGRAYGEVLTDVHALLHDRFGIDHVTIQAEPPWFEESETHL
jgi:cobalt-zinc-cadmium efflux system protein